MSKRIEKKKIRKLITTTIQAVDMKVATGVQKTGVNMSYDYIEDRVYVDCERVVQACEEIKGSINLNDYIKTLTLHELGHALDREVLLAAMPRMIEIAKIKRKHAFMERRENLKLFTMDIESHEMDIVFEETAWKYARELNEQYGIVREDIFKQVEEHSMASYFKFYEKDLINYKRLVAAERMEEEWPAEDLIG